MSALVPAPAWHEDVVLGVGADLAHLFSDVPSAEARVRVELFEPVRRGSARPLDPDRRTAPVHEHPRSLGAPRPAGLPAPDEPLNVGVRVLGAEPAGLGEHFPPTVGHHRARLGRATRPAQALAPTARATGGAIRNRPPRPPISRCGGLGTRANGSPPEAFLSLPGRLATPFVIVLLVGVVGWTVRRFHSPGVVA